MRGISRGLPADTPCVTPTIVHRLGHEEGGRRERNDKAKREGVESESEDWVFARKGRIETRRGGGGGCRTIVAMRRRWKRQAWRNPDSPTRV